jgi:hypothetical protein
VGSVEEERGARVTAAAVSHCKDGWSAEGGHDKQGTDLPDLMGCMQLRQIEGSNSTPRMYK